MRFQDLTGQRFGRLTVLSCIQKAHTDENGAQVRTLWACMCDCGVECCAGSNDLKVGHTLSCGCLKIEMQTTHGLSRDPFYSTWAGIRSRIRNPSHDSYPNYGGRNLGMEPEWEDCFQDFREWILINLGPKPSPEHTIDRVDNELGYLKGNLRWATPSEQQNNRSDNLVITYQGVTATLAQHCGRLGLNYSTVRSRLGHGWTVAEALGTPTDGDRSKRRPKVEEPQAA